MDPLVKNTLAIVNRARKHVGLEPLEDMPLGVRSNPRHCPIANALPDDPSVTGWQVYFAEEEAARALAKAMRRKVVHRSSRPNYDWPQREKREWRVPIMGTTLGRFVDQFDDRWSKRNPLRRYAVKLVRDAPPAR